jgi:hypothetical protein
MPPGVLEQQALQARFLAVLWSSMPYRRFGEALHAVTARGTLTVTQGPGRLELSVGDELVRITDRAVMVHTPTGTERWIATTGRIILARNPSCTDLALWAEAPDPAAHDELVMRRIFGIPPFSSAREASTHQLDELGRHLRTALRAIAPDSSIRATEVGSDHRMLLVELADRHEIYGTRLFRHHAPLLLTLHRDGRMMFTHDARELPATRELSINPSANAVRFSHGANRELGQLACPWLGASDRAELARRLACAVARR